MKRFSLLVAVPVLVAGFLMALPHAAHAVLLDQICADNVVLTWDPPLTNTPQTLNYTATGQLSDCSSRAYPSGTYSESGTVPGATCTSLFYPGSATRTFVWTSGGSSLFSYNWNSTRVNGNIVYLAVGSIRPGGVFGGNNAKEVITVPAPDPTACSSTGVSRLFGLGTLQIGV
ncbi:hypothetical protein [Nonomuraea sp. NPDC050786]|uniref:hypothetical protein n=1 Tax=Nonomuraea sp. NPDC050786 TaxID=3154840 RepID=UPI0033F9EC60